MTIFWEKTQKQELILCPVIHGILIKVLLQKMEKAKCSFPGLYQSSSLLNNLEFKFFIINFDQHIGEIEYLLARSSRS